MSDKRWWMIQKQCYSTSNVPTTGREEWKREHGGWLFLVSRKWDPRNSGIRESGKQSGREAGWGLAAVSAGVQTPNGHFRNAMAISLQHHILSDLSSRSSLLGRYRLLLAEGATHIAIIPLLLRTEAAKNSASSGVFSGCEICPHLHLHLLLNSLLHLSHLDPPFLIIIIITSSTSSHPETSHPVFPNSAPLLLIHTTPSVSTGPMESLLAHSANPGHHVNRPTKLHRPGHHHHLHQHHEQIPD